MVLLVGENSSWLDFRGKVSQPGGDAVGSAPAASAAIPNIQVHPEKGRSRLSDDEFNERFHQWWRRRMNNLKILGQITEARMVGSRFSKTVGLDDARAELDGWTKRQWSQTIVVI